MGRGDKVGLLIQHKDKCSSDGSFRGEGWLHDFDGPRCPDSSHQAFHDFHETRTVALDGANENHGQVAVREDLCRMSHSVIDLLHPINFLHGSQENLDREEFCNLITNVEGRVEDNVPYSCSEEELLIVLDSTEDGFTEEKVSDEATSKNSDHARQPVGQGMFPGEGKSAGAEVLPDVEAAEGTVGDVEVWKHL